MANWCIPILLPLLFRNLRFKLAGAKGLGAGVTAQSKKTQNL
jgi:hypothetical protein